MTTGLLKMVQENDGPLCPNGIIPTSFEHQAEVATLDAFYNATAKDENGEMAPDVDKAYHAAAYASGRSRMRLYRDAASAWSDGRVVTVESYYFRCMTCGLILAATKVADR